MRSLRLFNHLGPLAAASLFAFLGCNFSFAQSTLALSSGVANGGTVALTLTLTSPAGSEPAGVQFTLSAPAGVSNIVVTGGATLTGAGKTLLCNGTSAAYMCLATGLNTSIIANGVLANVTVTLASGATSASIAVSNVLGASVAAAAIAISGSGGTVTTTPVASGPTVTGLTCTPTILAPGASSACTVTLSGAAPSGGATVSLSSSGAAIAVPSSVTAQTGAASATFTAMAATTVASSSTSQSATVTATLNGASQSATLNIAVTSADATASFVGLDTKTQGSWRGFYGIDGYSIIGDLGSLPSYAAVAPSGSQQFVWAASTNDVRALQKASSSTDRIAACWYGASSFTIDVNLTDGNAHQVALYLLDWDALNRAERVDILNSTGTVLDTRNVSGFSGGQYLVWKLTGHVAIRVTNAGALNTVASGIFFDSPGTATAPAAPTTGATATFLKTDTSVSGSWKGVYGGDGYNVISNQASYPSYVTVTPSGNASYTWSASTTAAQALQKAGTATDRIAACWYGPAFSVDLAFNDQNPHQVALYLLDWDGANSRSERVDVVDANGNVLDTRSVTAFSAGTYLVWNLSGHVVVRITNTGTWNAVLSGIFFGGATASAPASTASFVKTDTTTAGTWKGVYGADGYNVINNAVSYPAYVTVTPSASLAWTWAASVTNLPALQKAAATDRIAACWYTPTSFTVDLKFNDANPHQLALYLLDWDNFGGGRNERVDILDATNTVLDTRTASSFVGGQYLVWNVTGHVVVRITNLNANSNAVLSGIFFR